MMETIISNIVVAGAIGVIAWFVGRVPRWIPVARILWIVVLLKLVTPPLFDAPIVPRAALLGASAGVESAWDAIRIPREPVASLASESPTVAPAIRAPVTSPQVSPEAVVAVAPAVSPPTPAPSVAVAPAVSVGVAVTPPSPRTAGLFIWLFGAAILAFIVVRRAWIFRRALRHAARPDAALLREVHRVAERLELDRVPEVLLVPARISPCLWAPLARARLLLPSALWASLTPQERESILAHELGHYKRRDHWVRRLELTVSTLFWWLPLVYWARYKLHESEELCCDALVVHAFPDRVRDYASALVKTLDFLAVDAKPLPPAASGVRRVNQLKRRLEMVLDQSTPRLPGRGKRMLAVVGAVLALGFVPTFAQSEKDDAALRRIEQRAQHVRRAMRSLKRAELPAEVNRLARVLDELAAKHRSLGGHPASFKKGRGSRRAAAESRANPLARYRDIEVEERLKLEDEMAAAKALRAELAAVEAKLNDLHTKQAKNKSVLAEVERRYQMLDPVQGREADNRRAELAAKMNALRAQLADLNAASKQMSVLRKKLTYKSKRAYDAARSQYRYSRSKDPKAAYDQMAKDRARAAKALERDFLRAVKSRSQRASKSRRDDDILRLERECERLAMQIKKYEERLAHARQKKTYLEDEVVEEIIEEKEAAEESADARLRERILERRRAR